MTTRRQEATAIVDQENYYMYVLMLTSGNVSKVAVRNHPLAGHRIYIACSQYLYIYDIVLVFRVVELWP